MKTPMITVRDAIESSARSNARTETDQFHANWNAMVLVTAESIIDDCCSASGAANYGFTGALDDEPTRPRSPSAQHRLGLATCPACDGKSSAAAEICPFCEGAGRVTLARHHAYVGLEPKKE